MEYYSFLPTEEFVRPLGRTIMLDDCRVLSLSASGVEFTYKGSELQVSFYGDSTTQTKEDEPQPWRDQARVAVIVDGIIHLDTMLKKPKEVFTVFGDMAGEEVPAEHVVRILKLSEPRMSYAGLGEIRVFAEAPAKPTERKERYIEFIGDSITCGYGVEAPNEQYRFSNSRENAMKAYAYQTAEALGADCSLICYSGHGLVSGYTDDPAKPKLEERIQPYYELFSYSYNQFRDLELWKKPWDFTKERQPDVIVINLGTNDSSYVQDEEEKRGAFEKSFSVFLGQVHDAHPKSKIVVAYGMMEDSLYETECIAAELFRKKSGYADAVNFRFTLHDGEKNGLAADFHPSEYSQKKAAEELAAFLREYMKW